MSKELKVVKATFPALTNLPALTGYGVTRSKGKWAFYLFKTEAGARRFADGLMTPTQVEVNVSQDRPYKFVEL